MGEYYIIAAGGTGAMCARSFIYMAAAGCAQENSIYHILLMDKDKESDALTACNNLLRDYKAMREQLGKKPGTYTFPEIRLHEWNFTQAIVEEYHERTGRMTDDLTNLTLNKLLNPDGKDEKIARLLSTMYTTDELNADLDKGFYGHPNIGAPVFDYVRDRFLDPQKNTFMKSLRATLSNGKAYVYLFGSLFGGTGATVIPNVVLALRSIKDPVNPANHFGETRLVLGGSVIMPYFKLPACPADSIEKLERVVPVDSKFAGQTKEALSYYHESGLLNNMMNLTLLGTSKLDVTSEAFARGGAQSQHFHIVLMVAAVAANRFFDNRLGTMKDAVEDDTIVPKGELILWKVTPNDPANQGIYDSLIPGEMDLEEEYKKLAAFLRFSVVVGYYMRLKFTRDPAELKSGVEVLSTAKKMYQDRRDLDLRNINKDYKKIPNTDIVQSYKEPVANAGAICRGFIQFIYDVGLSGYDWTKYRIFERAPQPDVVRDGKSYYRYSLGSVDPNATDYFTERWTDFANLTNLKQLLEVQSLNTVLDTLTLNEIVSYQTMDTDRTDYVETRFPGSIATVYVRNTLGKLNIEKDFFGKIKDDSRWFCEIYDQLYKECV